MTDGGTLVEEIVRFFNTLDDSRVVERCHKALEVRSWTGQHSIAIARPSAGGRLAAVVESLALLRRAMPDIEYSVGAVASSGPATSFTWRAQGTHSGPLLYIPPTGRRLVFAGTCRLKLEGGTIRELFWAPELYEILEQTGRLCPAPADADAGAADVNRRAAAGLARAINDRLTDVDGIDEGTIVHGLVRLYVTDRLEMKQHVYGPGHTIRDVLGCLWGQFATIALSLRDVGSQGHTTTFKGTARVTRERGRFNYTFRCSFRSDASRVAECWIDVAPPPSLREYFQ